MQFPRVIAAIKPAFQQAVNLSTKAAKDVPARVAKTMPRNYRPLPLVVDKVEGVKFSGEHLKTGERHTVIDGLSTYSARNQGADGTGAIPNALVKGIKDVNPSRVVYHQHAGKSEEKILNLVKMPDGKIYIKNGGTEGFDVATKLMARWGTRVKGIENGKQKIIVPEGMFGGRSVNATAASSDPQARNDFGALPDDRFIKVPFNDAEAMAEAMKDPNVVGVLMEPILGEGGIVIPDDGYLQKVQELCKENNILFGLDEIQTGLGRTGDITAWMAFDLPEPPDIMLLAKSLGGGYLPISALFTKDAAVMDLIGYGDDGSTHSHFPLGTRMIEASIKDIEKLAKNAKEMGPVLLSGLEKIQEAFPDVVKGAHGKGLMIGLTLDKKVDGRAFVEKAMDNGMLLNFTHNNVVRVTPPLILNKHEAGEILQSITKTVSEFSSTPAKETEVSASFEPLKSPFLDPDRDRKIDRAFERFGFTREGVVNGTAGADIEAKGDELPVTDPSTGKVLAAVKQATTEDYHQAVEKMKSAEVKLQEMSRVNRGKLIGEMLTALRDHKEDLAILISAEVGKTLTESRGEIVEIEHMLEMMMGRSYQTPDRFSPSERAGHHGEIHYRPVGGLGVVTAFNFPTALIGWTQSPAMLAGNGVVHFPSKKAPLSALALERIFSPILKKAGLEGVFQVVVGDDKDIVQRAAADERLGMFQFTGSSSVGKELGHIVHERGGRFKMEGGGNARMAIQPTAHFKLAAQTAYVANTLTTGQRCTTLRGATVFEPELESFLHTYMTILWQQAPKDPLSEGAYLGPMITPDAALKHALLADELEATGEGKVMSEPILYEFPGTPGTFVSPALFLVTPDSEFAKSEHFSPSLFVTFHDGEIEEAVDFINDQPYGLTSGIFTRDVHDMQYAMGHVNSAMVHFNTTPGGNEAHEEFGGEKLTGNGRMSGFKADEHYMRPIASFINSGNTLALAQGVVFKT